MIKRISIVLVIVLLLSFSACQNFNSYQSNNTNTDVSSEHDMGNKGEGNMELTQRQIDILEQEGLPLDYNQLDDNQKKAIIAIEEMFSYLDEKYEVEFEFVGYRAKSSLDNETLIVCPKGATAADNVSVVRKDGTFSDNYATVYYRDDYESMIKTYMQTKASHIEVFSEIEEVTDVSDMNDLRPNVRATTAIYLIDSDIENSSVTNIANDFGEWYASGVNGNSCSFAFYVVPEATFWSITRFNRTNYNDNVIAKVNVIVRTDGSVVVR